MDVEALGFSKCYVFVDHFILCLFNFFLYLILPLFNYIFLFHWCRVFINACDDTNSFLSSSLFTLIRLLFSYLVISLFHSFFLHITIPSNTYSLGGLARLTVNLMYTSRHCWLLGSISGWVGMELRCGISSHTKNI